MDDQLPEGVIVSSDRIYDVEPYCRFIYWAEPDVWDSIFPWEFPQNGTKDQEEDFLARYFSKTEIHMQGYRFLKSAWYWIAIFNINWRVPAFTRWWLEKPTSIELLNDPNLVPFLLKQDAKPSTFFSEELPKFGEHFLTVVVPYLQKSIKDLLEKREAEQQQQPERGDSIVSQHAPNELREDRGLPTAQSFDSEERIVSQTLSLPTPTNMQHTDSANVAESALPAFPQSAPPHVTSAPSAPPPTAAAQKKYQQISDVHPPVENREKSVQQAHQLTTRVVSDESPFQQEIQLQSRKRGNSAARRFNSRPGGHFQPFQSHAFNERSSPVYISSGHGASPAPMHNHPRVTSAGHMELMPSRPQGQALPNYSPPVQFLPAHFGPSGPMHSQNFPLDAQGIPEHIRQYFGIPFGDRSNNQYPDSNFTGYPQVTYFPDSFRGDHRRDSFAPRAGRPRGHSINRGKNTRGRNSFSSQDRPPFMGQGDAFSQKPIGNLAGKAHAFKQRRGSIIHEANWRSGSDNPQIQQADHTMKENIAPSQNLGGPNHRRPSLTPHPRMLNNLGPPMEHVFEQQTATQTPHVHRNLYQPRPTHRNPPPHSIDPLSLSIEQSCGRDWIGKECTLVDKVLVFDVPSEWSNEKIQSFFAQFGKVEHVSRSVAAVSKQPATRFAHEMMWIQFQDSLGPRNCLANKPERWYDDKVLRVEVPKQFWDCTHPKYIFAEPGSSTRPPEESKAVPQVPMILRRPDESAPTTRAPSVERPVTEEAQSPEITPTPSGASTPKKRKKGSKNKKGKTDLRKASLNPKGDQNATSADANAPSDGTSGTLASGGDLVVNAAAVAEKHESVTVDTTIKQQKRSGSAQTEAQTASEPAQRPADIVETKMPVPETHAHQGCDKTLQRGSADTDTQTTSELGFSPTDEIKTSLPELSQPFPEEKETTPQETETARVDEMPESAPVSGPAAPTGTEVTPPKRAPDPSDDSFHTAIASPPEENYNAEDDKSVVSESETVIAGTEKAVDESVEENASNEVEWPSDVVLPGSPSSTVSAKTVTKVHIPQLPAKSRVASDSHGSSFKSLMVDSPAQAAPAVSPALPTPAYVTAPNTPAAAKDSPKEATKEEAKEEVKEAKATREPAKQPEKPKGPAQTESFSLFGKKKEKKTKAGKKGTVKGKPKVELSTASDVASGSTSRVTSGALTPNPEQIAQDVPPSVKEKRSGEGMNRADSKLPDNSDKAPSATQDTEKVMPDDLAGRSSAQQETPSKRKGVRGLLSIFTGGQASLFQSKSDQTPPPSRDPLTGTKAQDHHPETVTKAVSDHVNDVVEGREADVEAQVQDGDVEVATPEVGLGISTVDGDASLEENGSAKSKSKKKKKKSKKKTPAEGSSDAPASSSTLASDQNTASRKLGFVENSFSGFGFGGGKVEANEGTHPHPALLKIPSSARDDGDETNGGDNSGVGSESSPRTVSFREDSRTPDVSSPTPSTPTKRMPPKPAGSSHLVQATTPKWMRRKRQVEPKRADTPPETEAEDEEEGPEDAIWVIQEVEAQSDASSAPSIKRQEKVYLYIGKDATTDNEGDGAEASDVEQSPKQMQELARVEQQRRKAADDLEERKNSD